MEKSYSIKASYKGNMYVIKGYFPEQDSLKKQIVSRNIKNLNKQSSFIIQYPEGIQNLQQAYKYCEKQNKNTFKVNINKKKKSKNQFNSPQNSQNSTQVLKHLSMIDQMTTQVDHIQSPTDRRSLNLYQPQQKPKYQSIMVKTVPKGQKPRKTSEQLDLENQLRNQQPVTQFGLKDFQQSRQLLHNQPQLPNFQLSEILEKPPLQPQDKQNPINTPVQTTYPKHDKKQKVLEIQNNFSTYHHPSKPSKKCTSCQEDNILAQTLCLNCLEQKRQQDFQKMSKSLEESIKIKIKEEIQFDVNTKVKRIQNQLKKQISQLRLKSNQQQQQILHLSDQNKELKQTLRAQQNKNKLLQNQLNKIKLQFQDYADKIKLFEKDFQTINQINFELQNSKIMLEHRIDQLAKKKNRQSDDSDSKDQKIKSSHEIRNQEQKQIKSRPSIPEQRSASQNIKKNNPLVHQPKNEEKKVANQMPKEQLQNLFMNPSFPDQGKAESQSDKKNSKPIDGTIREIEKASILKVGETYQPQINIKNTGTNKWPSQVFIFEKDSKRTKKIQSLSPKQECIFKDDTVYKGQREGQNIQIKYQVYYEQNGQKNYIGLPVSIFIKVKKAESDSILAELEQDEMVESERNVFGSGKINEEELKRSRVQVQGFGKKIMGEVELEIKKSQAFVRMINEKKRQLNVGNQTTKNIKTQLQSMGINEQNFKQCDPEMIEEIIKNFQVIDIIKN